MAKTKPNGAAESEAPAKRVRMEQLNDCLEELSAIQTEIGKLDLECAREQMKVQVDYWRKMKPFFEKRRPVLKKIPNFWGDVFKRCGELRRMCREDKEILNHLENVDLEDNLDEQGSYRLTLEFGEGAREYFEPLVITKAVKVQETASENGDVTSGVGTTEEVIECTEIKFKEGKDPREAVKTRLAKNDDEDSMNEFSIFQWFTNTGNNEDVDDDFYPNVGELIKQEVWLNPVPFVLKDDEDDEEYDGEDPEDDEVL